MQRKLVSHFLHISINYCSPYLGLTLYLISEKASRDLPGRTKEF